MARRRKCGGRFKKKGSYTGTGGLSHRQTLAMVIRCKRPGSSRHKGIPMKVACGFKRAAKKKRKIGPAVRYAHRLKKRRGGRPTRGSRYRRRS